MASDVKGYVVRGDYHNGACAWVCLGPSGEHLASPRLAERSLFLVLKDAIRAQADVWVIFDDVSIFRVHADGREERLPSLAEALAEIERLRGADPLAALEAAERRLLDAGGWTQEPGEPMWWRSATGRLTPRDQAVSIARRAAKKGVTQ